MKTKEIDLDQIKEIEIPQSWKGKALVVLDKDTILIKRVQIPTISEIRKKLKKVKGLISEEEIEQEIQNYRKEK